jgi:hypothetical protein
MKGILILSAVLALTVLPALAPAGPESDANPAARRFRQLERDIPSLYLLNGLNLSTQQVAQVARIAQAAATVHARQARTAERLVDSRRRDLERETSEILASSARRKDPAGPLAPNPMLARRMAESRRAYFESRREVQEAMEKCADDLLQVLSASQKRIIENFTPCFIPPSDFRNPERVGQAAADTSFVEQVLAGLRKEGKAPSDEAMENALERLTPYVMEKRHIPYSETAETSTRTEMEAKLRRACARMGGLDDADFELEKKKIAGEVFLPKSGVGDAQATRSKIQHYLLNPGIVDIVCAKAGLPAPQAPQAAPELPDGRAAVRAAALLAGMDLSAEQARRLLDITDRALAAKAEVESEVGTAMAGACPTYERLRKELAAGQPSREGEAASGRFHSRVKVLRDDKLVQELLKFEAEADKCLTAAQVEYLNNDQGPRPSPAPARVAADRFLDRARRTITGARNMSAIEFAKGKEKLSRDFVAAYIEANGFNAGDVDADAETKRACEVLAKARELDQPAYTGSRDALASELCPRRSTPRDPTYGAKYHRGEPVKLLSQSTQLLFSQTGRDVLAALVKRL